MNNADLDLLIELHKRLTNAQSPLTNEDIAYFTGRIEQALKEAGALTTPEEVPPKKRWFDLRP